MRYNHRASARIKFTVDLPINLLSELFNECGGAPLVGVKRIREEMQEEKRNDFRR